MIKYLANLDDKISCELYEENMFIILRLNIHKIGSFKLIFGSNSVAILADFQNCDIRALKLQLKNTVGRIQMKLPI